MAVKHLVWNENTGKPELKTFKSEQAYREYRQRPFQKQKELQSDLVVFGESANKKLRQLEKKGLTNSPAYKQALHQIHLLTGDTTAKRFPQKRKDIEKLDTTTVQRALQAAYKFNKYETATPGGLAKAQRRARKGFNKKFENAKALTQKQYDIISEMAEVLNDMYGALIPGSTQLFNSLIDIENNTHFDETDIKEFAIDLQNEIDNAPKIASEYTRHLLSQGIDQFAHGTKPNAKALVKEVVDRERQRLEIMRQNLESDYPYK